MNGSYSFSISDKNVEIQITLDRNVSVLRGPSGTGKTTLCEFIKLANKKGSGVHLKAYKVEVKVLDDDLYSLLEENPPIDKDIIYVIDEQYDFKRTSEFVDFVKKTSAYFLIIGRANLKCLPCSALCVYELDTTYDTSLNKEIKTLRQKYPFVRYGTPSACGHIITEDSKSGKQFFSKAMPIPVRSAEGKDNISNTINDLPDNALIIADGAALGFVMDDIIEAMSRGKYSLVIPESFEYVLLRTVVMPRDVTVIKPIVDYHKHLTWEQHYTDVITEETKDTIAHYSKDHLNPYYSYKGNAEKILKAYYLGS